ncbi:predicted protein [Nematostella vectensis]|uniref:Uncharacterized protein n=1 Tax=Nematostella vectensis TaxID=45351 RepID=A7RSH4_NEMVE|nr:predicted protein [Nematostella vectensis]|eukprot:XP_001637700.1 predicted protein [Nematostella vectensis]
MLRGNVSRIYVLFIVSMVFATVICSERALVAKTTKTRNQDKKLLELVTTRKPCTKKHKHPKPTQHTTPCTRHKHTSAITAELKPAPTTRPCEARPCTVGEWSSWGNCSHECGSIGEQHRHRDVVHKYIWCGVKCVCAWLTVQMIPRWSLGTACVVQRAGAYCSLYRWSPGGNGGLGSSGKRAFPLRMRRSANQGDVTSDDVTPNDVDITSNVKFEASGGEPLGSWGEWTSWSACSVTCGGGQRFRTRVCQTDGAQCQGKSLDVQVCAESKCALPVDWETP